ncbi:MAG: efflux RND transporter periplasmic adaptor subunit [Rikenellaceae bacterium]
MYKIKFLICGAVACIAMACVHKQRGSATMPPIGVEVAQAQRSSICDRVEVASQVASMYDVVIQPRIDGFLNAINYSKGMPVSRGDLLFVIDPSQYNISLLASRADLQKAEAEERLAYRNYERALPLVGIDAISRSDMDQYSATHSAARASVASAREMVNNAKLNLGYTKIYAPIDGLVAESPANVGDYVGPSTALSTLTTISYIDTVEVAIPIPSPIYMRNVTSSSQDSYDNSELLSDIELTLSGGERYEYEGEYYYTQKDTPTSSSTVVVVAKFPNPDRKLKSGMFARVKSNIGPEREVVTVPQVAVSQTQGVNSVWVMAPDSVVEFREVSLGATMGEDWIIDSGVDMGEYVLLTGQLKVHNGAKVAPQNK